MVASWDAATAIAQSGQHVMSNLRIEKQRHAPLYDVHPRTGATIEIFWADRELAAAFGLRGSGGCIRPAATASHQVPLRVGHLRRATARIEMRCISLGRDASEQNLHLSRKDLGTNSGTVGRYPHCTTNISPDYG